MSELPAGWRIAPLAEATSIVMGQSPPSEDYNTIGSGRPFLQGKAEFTHFNPKPSKYCRRPLKVGVAGSVLMSVRAPVGDVNLADQDYIIGRGLAALRPKDGDALFLFYALLQNKGRIAALGSGTTFQSINRAVLDGFEVAFPPVPEQFAIAAALRAAQDARDARRRELALERERKAALMEELFTRGTRGEPCEGTGIGPMPQSWMVEPLGSFVAGTPQNGLYKHADLYGEGTPIIRITDFNNDGLFVARDLNRVRLTAAEVENYRVASGDILINRVNSLSHLGKCCLVPEFPESTVFESNMMRFRLNVARLMPEFLQRFLLTEHCRRVIRGKAKLAVAQASINQSDVQGLQIPIPPLDEQRDIADVLTACDRKIAALESEAAVHDELFRALLEELMSGRISTVSLIPVDSPPTF